MVEKKIIYFEKCGPQNTEKLLEAAKERAGELGIKHIVIATTHGGTALKAKEAFKNIGITITAVSLSHGSASAYKNMFIMTRQEREELESKGIQVHTGSNVLSYGVESSFQKRYGGRWVSGAVVDSLYRFSVGMKVCVEVVLMAADAGLIPVEDEVMAIGGTGSGADTAVVVKPAYPRTFHELEIREIIAKPRDAKANY